MHAVDIADDTYIAAPVAVVARVVADPARWARWWPDLVLATSRDRGVKGRQWSVEGAVTGTAEIWIEPWWHGAVLHFYLRAEQCGAEASSAGSGGARSRRSREQVVRVQAWKAHVHRLKDDLEGRAVSGARDGDDEREGAMRELRGR